MSFRSFLFMILTHSSCLLSYISCLLATVVCSISFSLFFLLSVCFFSLSSFLLFICVFIFFYIRLYVWFPLCFSFFPSFRVLFYFLPRLVFFTDYHSVVTISTFWGLFSFCLFLISFSDGPHLLHYLMTPWCLTERRNLITHVAILKTLSLHNA